MILNKICGEIFSITFSGKNMKEAYLTACKWVASNIVAKDEYNNLLVCYKKINNIDLKQVKVIVYITTSEDEVREEHCIICKEMHRSFLLNNDVNCSRCELKGYQNRIDEKLSVKSEYFKRFL